jgi:dihydroorotate dehydrogenase electron transfer subunit
MEARLSISKLLNAEILENHALSSDIYRLILQLPAEQNLVLSPGQFIMLSCPGPESVYLKRPLSVAWFANNELHLLYRILGKGTHNLSLLKTGQTIDLIAPCGKAFSLPPKGNLLFMAGGMGVAPLSFLCQQALQSNLFSELYFFYGTSQSSDRIPFTFEEDSRVHFFHHSDYLQGHYQDHILSFFLNQKLSQNFIQAYSCGPTLMIKNFSEWCSSNGLPLQVSLEKHMACGMGSCFGCSIQTRQGMQSVCHDGPVFNHQDILWDQV